MQRSLLVLSVLPLLGACVSSQPSNPTNICHMFEDRHSWYRAAERTEERWGTPVPVTMAFVYQESSFQARARPERRRLLGFIPWRRPSSARGYAQALDMTWDEYREQTGSRFARRSNFSDAVDFIGWYNRHSFNRNNIAPHDARNLYLAYHEGHGGFSRGSYRGKEWLLNVANRVQNNADRYELQYRSCRDDLDRNWFMRTFF